MKNKDTDLKQKLKDSDRLLSETHVLLAQIHNEFERVGLRNIRLKWQIDQTILRHKEVISY